MRSTSPFRFHLASTAAVAVVLIAVVAACAAALLAPTAAHAAQVTSRFSVDVDGKYQFNPTVSGTLVVAQQKDASGWNLYGYDLVTHEKFPVCVQPGDQKFPAISGTTVVWQDARSGSADVYGATIDPVTHAVTEFPVCTSAEAQTLPAIDDGWVVWQDRRDGDWDIYGATVTGATVADETAICAYKDDQTAPDVSGDFVVWTDHRYADTDIRGYNRVAKYEFPICLSDVNQSQAAIDGDTVVWRDWRGITSSSGGTHPGPAIPAADIYGFDLTSSREFVVSSAPGNQQEPAISDDMVVWTDASKSGTKQGLNVWAKDLTLDQLVPLALYPAWQGNPAIDGWHHRLGRQARVGLRRLVRRVRLALDRPPAHQERRRVDEVGRRRPEPLRAEP